MDGRDLPIGEVHNATDARKYYHETNARARKRAKMKEMNIIEADN